MEQTEPSFFKSKIYYIAAILVLMLIVIFWWWRAYFYPFQTTEDASIAGLDHTISAVQSGKIMQVAVDDGAVVKKGDLLFTLDDTLLLIEREKASAGVDHANDEVKLQKIRVDLAKDDLDRATKEYSGGVISQEAFTHVEKTYQMMQAQLQSINSLADVQEATLKEIETQIQYSQVTAPIDGVIAMRWHDPGDVVRAGQTVLSLMDLTNIWITANIEETKVSSIRIGAPVIITVDAYPGLEFQGNVLVVGAAAASQFALIPQNNASGNFTKVTQRIPLKISMKTLDNAQGLYLRPGMSVKIKIRTR
jgi:membrane fusion protein (multidrug efflux system)